jgi:hypothetical protein
MTTKTIDVQPGVIGAPHYPWTREDIEFLLEKHDELVENYTHPLQRKRLLVADTDLGIPTIHDIRGAEHLWMGMFLAETDTYKINFDGGGAMQRSPSGKGWCAAVIEGEYAYDDQGVRDTLQAWLDGRVTEVIRENGESRAVFS